MKISTLARFSFATIALAALASCAANTQLTSSWADPTAANRHFQKVVVVGATPKAATRRMYEDNFVAELQKRGVTAMASYTVLSADDKLDKDAAAAKLKEMGVDGIIVTRLIDKEQTQTYYPPTYSSMAAPSAYYGGWYGYYNMGYSYMTTPGYVEQNNVWKLETNLYDFQNDKLAWSGLTETTLMTGDAPENEIQPLIYALVTDMQKHKVLPGKK